MTLDHRLRSGDGLGTGLLRLGLGGLVIGLGPQARVRAYTWDATGDATWGRSLALVVAVSVAVWLVSLVQHRWAPSLLAIAVAAVAGAAMLPIQGKTLAVWLVVTTLVSAWGVHRIRPVWFLGRPDGSPTPGLLLLAILSAFAAGNRDLPPRASLAFTALMAMPVVLSLPLRPAQFVRSKVERFAQAVGTSVGFVLLALVSLVAVVAPWAAQRLVRWNSIGAASPGGWISREPASLQGRRMWMDRADRSALPRWHRLHGFVATVLTLVLLVPVASGVGALVSAAVPRAEQALGSGGGDAAEEDGPPNVIEDRIRAEPWFDQLSRENELAFERGHLSQWVGTEIGDVDGELMVTRDGRRGTWSPPAPTCGAVVDVWMFGGSTTFSVAARDAHTLPSALARAAHAKGLSLQVLNWGIPGDVAWQEGRRLERALAGDLEAPDLVVFFDGFNDMSTVGGLGRDRGSVGDFVGPLDRLQMAALTQLGSIDDGKRYVLDFESPVADRTPAEQAASALDQYAAANDVSRRLLESYGIPSVRFAQPTLWSRDEVIPGEPVADEDSKEVDRRFRLGLPDDVVDLADMFDAADGPIYNDGVHTDERGNKLIAAELYRRLEPQLEALAARKGQPCS